MVIKRMALHKLNNILWSILVALLFSAAGVTAQTGAVIDSALAEGYRYYDQPIDPDQYIVRPGEKLVVTFVNTNLASITLTVGPEGKIVQRNLGVLKIAGQTLSDVRRQLHDPLSQLYNAEEIDISVSDPYPVWISVTGSVTSPGSYKGYTSQRVSEILNKAGGVSADGSTRDIVFTGGPQQLTVDIDRSVYLADDSKNPCLYAGTSIFVPEKSDSLVSIVGEVKQPRMIELTPGDDLELLLQLAGGVKRSADRSQIHVVGDSARVISGQGAIESGDVIAVPAYETHSNRGAVLIFGAVVRPGRFQYRDGLTLADALGLAGGTTADANALRITVFRRPTEDQYGRLSDFRFPISAGVGGKSHAGEVTLNPYDSVFVPKTLGFVQVSGMVRNPGYYPYVTNRDAAYYIGLAGGFATEADKTKITLYDRVAGTSHDSPVDVLVGDGDGIIAKTAEQKR